MTRKQLVSSFLALFICGLTFAQKPSKPNASEIYNSIKKLNFLGSVLYVAAHPDDENTRLISYFANEVHARTAYLSLTRGDGGQNLIGPEIRELLGVIRTQELLTAREIDGGEQFFSRANDFGYSKHPDETLAIWNKKDVLNDVVLAIRQFKPDIIINRFDHRSPGSTHGHHTSSAMLSVEAFDLTNNQSQFPDQLETTSVWQPKRLFFNTSWWFYGSEEKFEKADKSGMMGFDIGTYYPTLGLSNSEIASLSRSQHKSQGFGNTGTRGSQMEYVELIKGDMPKNGDIFEGINTTWSRVKGGEAIGAILEEVERNFDFTNPSASIPQLMEAYKLIQKLEDTHWKTLKTAEIKDIIAACSGLYLEAVSSDQHATAGETVQLNIEIINRSNEPIKLVGYETNNHKVSKNVSLQNNQKLEYKESLAIGTNQQPTTPYWLTKKGSLGMYNVENPDLIGKPETPREFNVSFNLEIENTPISFQKAVVYKMNDPVKGEVYKPFEIVPEAAAKIDEKVLIFNTDQEMEIPVTVTSGRNNLDASVTIAHPKDWNIYPESQNVHIDYKGESKTIFFKVIPPKNESEGLMTPIVKVGDHTYTKELIEIDYEHIPYQTVLLPSETKVVRLNIQKMGQNIGYIEGAGDVVPESLRQIGYEVITISPEDITEETLSRFDAIVVGVRAYNTIENLKYKQDILFDFVSNGGNMIVQYNTSHRLVTDNLAPFSIHLSRDRVTDENAKVSFIDKEHALLNYPNKISEKDFEGWTQERGLYFPDSWDKEFTPILEMHDKGESKKKGSLLVAKYGQGYYIYTGLSFFREFPAGVSGAYRLFANMLSIGKTNIQNQTSLND